MYKILEKEVLNPTVTKLVVEAPFVAKRAKAGQFIILRVNEDSERIPFTPRKGNCINYFPNCWWHDRIVKCQRSWRFNS